MLVPAFPALALAIAIWSLISWTSAGSVVKVSEATVESRSMPVANTSHPVLGKVPTEVEPMVNDPIAP